METIKHRLDFSLLATVALLLFAKFPVAWGAEAEAGKFQFLIGEVKITSASGSERTPIKGDTIHSGDTIQTGPGAIAQIRMTDGGFIAVRADTKMRLDQYVFNGREDGKERKIVSLLAGGFRAITGLIGNRNKGNYRITTPSATIGIRGTDHEPVVIPAGSIYPAGTYDRVYRGATIIETEKGKLIVNPNQVGFTPARGTAPILLPKLPDFYDTKSRVPEGEKDREKRSDKNSDKPRDLKTESRDSTVLTKPIDGDSGTNLVTPIDTTKIETTTTLSTEPLKTLDTSTIKVLEPIRLETTTTITVLEPVKTTTTVLEPIRSTTTILEPVKTLDTTTTTTIKR